MSNIVRLGAFAPRISEQFPELNTLVAAHLERDNEDLTRLRTRGILTRAELGKARQRMIKIIEKSLRDSAK